MDNSQHNWLKDWIKLANKEESGDEDFWVDTPFGRLKNPKFIPGEKSEDNEINITIQYEELENIKI